MTHPPLTTMLPHASTPPPAPLCLYCGHAELDHGMRICFGSLQCLCKQYVSRERPGEEGPTNE